MSQESNHKKDSKCYAECLKVFDHFFLPIIRRMIPTATARNMMKQMAPLSFCSCSIPQFFFLDVIAWIAQAMPITPTMARHTSGDCFIIEISSSMDRLLQVLLIVNNEFYLLALQRSPVQPVLQVDTPVAETHEYEAPALRKCD